MIDNVESPSSVPAGNAQSQNTQPVQPAAAQSPTSAPVSAPVSSPIPAPLAPQPAVGSDDRLWGAICYIPMLALLALIVKPESAFVRLHGRQGLLVLGLFFCTVIMYVLFWPLGPILGMLGQFALFVLSIYSAYLAFMGNWWKIPVLGDVAEKLPVDIFTKAATQAITGQQPPSTQDTDQSQPSDKPKS